MKLVPVLTEKSLEDSKKGFYTFWVESGMVKDEIKKGIEKIFEVKVKEVRTANYKSGEKRNFRGKMQRLKGAKKAFVSLLEGKIDLFEEKKGK